MARWAATESCQISRMVPRNRRVFLVVEFAFMTPWWTALLFRTSEGF